MRPAGAQSEYGEYRPRSQIGNRTPSEMEFQVVERCVARRFDCNLQSFFCCRYQRTWRSLLVATWCFVIFLAMSSDSNVIVHEEECSKKTG